MVVAYELKKTVDEIEHLTPDELGNWLAFFKLRQKRMDEEYKRAKRSR